MVGNNKEKKRTREEDNAAESMKPHHPFSQSIMLAPLPEFFEIPRIEQYDGLTDPEYHLALFIVHMLIYGSSATDSIKCRVFPSTLRKYALNWFSNLPPNSINNFSQLTSKFLSHFVLGKVYPKSVGCINDLKQRRNELLKDYVDSFNEEALQVDEPSPELQIQFIIKGLKSGLSRIPSFGRDP